MPPFPLPPWLLLSVTGDIRMCQLIRVQAKKKRVAWKSVRSIQTWKRRLEEWVSALERSGCCLINSDASIFSRRSFALGTRRGKNNLLLPFRVLVNEKKRDSTLVVLVEIDLFPSIFTRNDNLFPVSCSQGSRHPHQSAQRQRHQLRGKSQQPFFSFAKSRASYLRRHWPLKNWIISITIVC